MADPIGMSDIPKLPGYITEDVTNRKNARMRTLDYRLGMSYVTPFEDTEAGRPELSRAMQNTQDMPVAASMKMPGGTRVGDFTPTFVALDGKVLRFEAYMKEEVPEAPAEGYRIRQFSIFYFLVDDSIRVSEMKQENSGLAQGTFLKRHRVPRTDGEQGPGRQQFVSWEDMQVGQDVSIYGRRMLIVDCDAFTREFFDAKGIQQGESIPIPKDPYFIRRKAAEEKIPLKVHDDRRERFLAFNRKVLRFYCQWDDRNSIYGERRPYVLHFYLEDDTVEICEVHLPNDGRDSFPKLLRRQKLPLSSKEALQDIGSKPARFYTDKDLSVGHRINVFGRNFLLYDCDEFTKKHYEKKYGVADFPNLTDRIRTPAVGIPQRELPPPTGFGSDADSLGSIFNLIPKAPKRDEAKLMHFAGKALRFLAKFDEPAAPEDEERKFVLAFWLADDTISIFEPVQQNSGIIGGKFLERSQVKNASSGEFFKALDFSIGNIVVVNRYKFRIMDCDTFTQKYIESKGENIKSQLYNVSLTDIMRNLQKRYEEAREALRSAFHVMDEDHSGNITHQEFINSLCALHYDVSIEEAEPLLAWFDPDGKGYISYAEFCDAIVRTPNFPRFLANWHMEKLNTHGQTSPLGGIKHRSSPVAASAKGLGK